MNKADKADKTDKSDKYIRFENDVETDPVFDITTDTTNNNFFSTVRKITSNYIRIIRGDNLNFGVEWNGKESTAQLLA